LPAGTQRHPQGPANGADNLGKHDTQVTKHGPVEHANTAAVTTNPDSRDNALTLGMGLFS
jgi:hypothetical protein